MLRVLFLILFVPTLANAEALILEYKFSTDTGDFVTPPENAAYFFGSMDTIRIFDSPLPAWRVRQEMHK
ncbi:MAG: hypothetical protein H0X02_09330 [Nitrosomonas sp.]|nr:hypothetical protein [Nitrosomonas sp.]